MAQYLRKKTQIVVSYQVDKQGQPHCVVTQCGKDISRKPDDQFASLCYLTLTKLWEAAKSTFDVWGNPSRVPAALFISNFNVDKALTSFDFEQFEKEVLPKIVDKTNYGRVVRNWPKVQEALENMEPGDNLLVFDWVVELKVLQRQEKDQGSFVVPEIVKTDVEQLTNIAGAEFVKMTNMAFLPAYQAIHPNGVLHDDVYITDPTSSATNMFGFQVFSPPEVKMEVMAAQLPTASDAGVLVSATAENDHVMRVVRLMPLPRQKLSAADEEYLINGGYPDLLNNEKGGIGKTGMKGLRNVAGTGKVKECVDRLVQYFKGRLPEAQDEHVLHLACGRLAAMQSDYECRLKEGEWHLQFKNVNNVKRN